MEEKIIVGLCSICAGNVECYKYWSGNPESNIKTCSKCNAVEAKHTSILPVIEMTKPPKRIKGFICGMHGCTTLDEDDLL